MDLRRRPLELPRSIASRLSPRLRQVATLLLNGCSEKEVAAWLGVSFHTVHSYVKLLHKTLGVETRAEFFVAVMRTSRDEITGRVSDPPGTLGELIQRLSQLN